MMSLALCLEGVAQAPQYIGSSDTQTTCDSCLPASLYARSFHPTLALPGSLRFCKLTVFYSLYCIFKITSAVKLMNMCLCSSAFHYIR